MYLRIALHLNIWSWFRYKRGQLRRLLLCRRLRLAGGGCARLGLEGAGAAVAGDLELAAAGGAVGGEDSAAADDVRTASSPEPKTEALVMEHVVAGGDDDTITINKIQTTTHTIIRNLT